MRTERYLLIPVALVCGIAFQGRSEGQTFNELLDYPPTAKSVSMAGAVSSLAGDHSAVVYNPATLGFAKTRELRATIALRPSDLYHDKVLVSAGVIHPVTEPAVIGAQFAYLAESEGQAGVPRGYSAIGRVSCGVRLARDVSVGASAEFVHDAMAWWFHGGPVDPVVVRASSWGLDASVLCKMPTFNLGLSVLNLGPDITYTRLREFGRSEAIRIGASVTPLQMNVHELTLGTDVSWVLNDYGDRDWPLNLGAEYDMLGTLSLRGGYFWEASDRDGFGVGGGLTAFDWISADFAARILDYEYDTKPEYYLTVTVIPSVISK
jgi:hypothetical protein